MGDSVATRSEYFPPMVNDHLARGGASLVIYLLNNDFVISHLEIPDSGNDSTVAELLLMLSTIRDHLLLSVWTQVDLGWKTFLKVFLAYNFTLPKIANRSPSVSPSKWSKRTWVITNLPQFLAFPAQISP